MVDPRPGELAAVGASAAAGSMAGGAASGPPGPPPTGTIVHVPSPEPLESTGSWQVVPEASIGAAFSESGSPASTAVPAAGALSFPGTLSGGAGAAPPAAASFGATSFLSATTEASEMEVEEADFSATAAGAGEKPESDAAVVLHSIREPLGSPVSLSPDEEEEEEAPPLLESKAKVAPRLPPPLRPAGAGVAKPEVKAAPPFKGPPPAQPQGLSGAEAVKERIRQEEIAAARARRANPEQFSAAEVEVLKATSGRQDPGARGSARNRPSGRAQRASSIPVDKSRADFAPQEEEVPPSAPAEEAPQYRRGSAARRGASARSWRPEEEWSHYQTRVLRWPENARKAGLFRDDAGWSRFDDVLDRFNRQFSGQVGIPLDPDEAEVWTRENRKSRFILELRGSTLWVRAKQGFGLEKGGGPECGEALQESEWPTRLYHATTWEGVRGMKKSGFFSSMKRSEAHFGVVHPHSVVPGGPRTSCRHNQDVLFSTTPEQLVEHGLELRLVRGVRGVSGDTVLALDPASKRAGKPTVIDLELFSFELLRRAPDDLLELFAKKTKDWRQTPVRAARALGDEVIPPKPRRDPPVFSAGSGSSSSGGLPAPRVAPSMAPPALPTRVKEEETGQGTTSSKAASAAAEEASSKSRVWARWEQQRPTAKPVAVAPSSAGPSAAAGALGAQAAAEARWLEENAAKKAQLLRAQAALMEQAAVLQEEVVAAEREEQARREALSFRRSQFDAGEERDVQSAAVVAKALARREEYFARKAEEEPQLLLVFPAEFALVRRRSSEWKRFPLLRPRPAAKKRTRRCLRSLCLRLLDPGPPGRRRLRTSSTSVSGARLPPGLMSDHLGKTERRGDSRSEETEEQGLGLPRLPPLRKGEEVAAVRSPAVARCRRDEAGALVSAIGPIPRTPLKATGVGVPGGMRFEEVFAKLSSVMLRSRGGGARGVTTLQKKNESLAELFASMSAGTLTQLSEAGASSALTGCQMTSSGVSSEAVSPRGRGTSRRQGGRRSAPIAGAKGGSQGRDCGLAEARPS